MRRENVIDPLTRFFNWWNQVGEHNDNFPTPQSKNTISFDLSINDDNNATLNLFMLHIKHYIYKQRFFHVKEMQLDAIKNIKLEIEMNILPWNKTAAKLC